MFKDQIKVLFHNPQLENTFSHNKFMDDDPLNDSYYYNLNSQISNKRKKWSSV